MDINVTIKIQCPELATAILTLADVFGDYLNATAGQQVTRKGRTAPGATAATETAAAAETAQPAATEDTKTVAKAVTLEEVRTKLAELSQTGHQAKVKELIKSIAGVNKLTDVPAEKYAELLAAARAVA